MLVLSLSVGLPRDWTFPNEAVCPDVRIFDRSAMKVVGVVESPTSLAECVLATRRYLGLYASLHLMEDRRSASGLFMHHNACSARVSR